MSEAEEIIFYDNMECTVKDDNPEVFECKNFESDEVEELSREEVIGLDE